MIYVALALVALALVLLAVLREMLLERGRADERWRSTLAAQLSVAASEREMLLERIQAPERVVAPATDQNDAPAAVDFDDDDDYWKAREERALHLNDLLGIRVNGD